MCLEGTHWSREGSLVSPLYSIVAFCKKVNKKCSRMLVRNRPIDVKFMPRLQLSLQHSGPSLAMKVTMWLCSKFSKEASRDKSWN